MKQLEGKHKEKYNPPTGDGDGGDDPPPVRRIPRDDRGGNNTKDTTSLKPDVLETTMSPSNINNWFEDFEAYRHASGWDTGDHHVQKAYLKQLVSEEIRTAVNFKI